MNREAILIEADELLTKIDDPNMFAGSIKPVRQTTWSRLIFFVL